MQCNWTTMVMPYLGKLSLQIRTRINRVRKKAPLEQSANCISKSKMTNVFTIPNKIPGFLRSGFTYKFKANHLVYIMPKWHESRIYADCQQKLFLLEHDTGGRILLLTFLAKQKREYDVQKRACIYLLMFTLVHY